MGDGEGDSIGEPHEHPGRVRLALTCCLDEPARRAGRAAFPFFSLPQLDSTLSPCLSDVPAVNPVNIPISNFTLLSGVILLFYFTV